MIVEYSGSKKEEREVKSLCIFYRLELSMSEGSLLCPKHGFKNWTKLVDPTGLTGNRLLIRPSYD